MNYLEIPLCLKVWAVDIEAQTSAQSFPSIHRCLDHDGNFLSSINSNQLAGFVADCQPFDGRENLQWVYGRSEALTETWLIY